MSSEVMSFEFIKGLRLYYRYAESKEIEVLYNDEWVNLKTFIAANYGAAKTKSYDKQASVAKQ